MRVQLDKQRSKATLFAARVLAKIALIAGLLLAQGIILSVPAHAMSKPRPVMPCVSPIQFKMGESIFTIPRPGIVRVSSHQSDASPNAKRVSLCHANFPLEVFHWKAMVSPQDLIQISDDFAKKNGRQFINPIELRVTKLSPEIHKEYARSYKPLYQNVQQLLKNRNVKINDLPKENGFSVLKGAHIKDFIGPRTLYISEDKELLSPAGGPAIFVCLRELCEISIWDGQIIFDAGYIYTKTVPQERWKDLYLALLKLRESIIAPVTPRLKPSKEPE